MRGLLRWKSLRRRRIVRCGDEDGALFADCFGADVGPCGAAYDWRRLWRGGSGGAAGSGDGDADQPVSGDGSDTNVLGFLYGAWSRGKRLYDGRGRCLLAARFAGEDRCVAAAPDPCYVSYWFFGCCRGFLPLLLCGAGDCGDIDCALFG